MAVAYASVATNSDGGSPSSAVCNKPSGLQVGDTMVMAIQFNAQNNSLTAKSDWSNLSGTANQVTSQEQGNIEVALQQKVADAGDVAASTFSWNFAGSSGTSSYVIHIYRFTGNVPISVFSLSAVTADSTPSYSNTVTPPTPNSILLFLVAASANAASASVAGYAITTSDPTWTERADVFQVSTYDPSFDHLLAGATGPRSATTATGNSSCTITGISDSIGVMIVVEPQLDAAVSPAVVSATVSVQAASVTGGATVSPAVVTTTVNVQAPTISTPAAKWTNPDKSSSSWTNPDKS